MALSLYTYVFLNRHWLTMQVSFMSDTVTLLGTTLFSPLKFKYFALFIGRVTDISLIYELTILDTNMNYTVTLYANVQDVDTKIYVCIPVT